MDQPGVTKFENVRLRRNNSATEHLGTLHLTAHHLIFKCAALEQWLGYPLIHSAHLHRPPRLAARRDGLPPTRTEVTAWAEQARVDIRSHHFVFLTLRCADVRQLYAAFAAIKRLACVGRLEQLYAFSFGASRGAQADAAWALYDAQAELGRMGVGREGGAWRVSAANRAYALCATYPAVVAVPARISDTTLTYAAAHRSKRRLPVLAYLHANGASMTRASQPMVGLKQARSVQDEKLVEAIVASADAAGGARRPGGERVHVIIDARPTTNAVANRAVGAGSENMDHYRRCRKEYLGIDNIHVMRAALARLVDALDAGGGGEGVVARLQRVGGEWLRHLANILVGVRSIVETMAAGRHVLVHCSDGWDRTAQLTSLAQLCLDPYYRTARGFAVLVEKEWMAFGHQFTLRCGHLGHADRFRVSRVRARDAAAADDAEPEDADAAASEADEAASSMFGRLASRALRGVQSRISSAIQAASDNLDDADDLDPFSEFAELQPGYVAPSDRPASGSGGGGGFRLVRAKHDHETSPVFQQFLDCVFQLSVQHPAVFEFNEEFLLDLFYHVHAAQFGSFLGNSMREREGLRGRTRSVWEWMFRHADFAQSPYANALYLADPAVEARSVIAPDPAFLQYWTAMFSGHDPAGLHGDDAAADPA
ncbi:phosphatidylinositol-3-phosphatase ymr1 [Coemansia interrupta]|uniref:Phosphatidylinositol-3-phosphatase ymr1 n=1 Tax=Coemansia interrupta TaxID=1126814 RepID=A0A9W8LFR9_9FUNG|nr:phosphatidylinositol-3-phosphatase ymr1 [Coemansia interrupta]